MMPPSPGTVYLVGAGPGDPELLTVKAHRLLSNAQVVVYDRLVSDALLTIIPESARRIFVGKPPGGHIVLQEEIHHILIEEAITGRDVVRLKGGDPLIFARGGEEALALAKAGIPFEIVPGITAAAGAGAYAGIPLTHRDLATGVRFVTGHAKEDGTLDLNWKNLVDPQTTLVIYMGLASLHECATKLMAAGMDADTPVAAIQSATCPDQREVLSPLSRIAAEVEKAALKSPALIIIGEVVTVGNDLKWFA